MLTCLIPSSGWTALERASYPEPRTLAQTRDLLLPRLMSGELRVREAENIMEGVA